MSGERDQILTLLTDNHGVIKCYYKGAKKGFGRDIISIQPLAFSEFELFSGKGGYSVDSASIIDPFLEVATDIELCSLALYLGELTALFYPERGDGQSIRLYLNTLHAIRQRKSDIRLIKASYELRITAMSGFLPSIDECRICGCDIEYGRFNCLEGGMSCESCGGEGFPVSKGTYAAIKHIISAKTENLYSFSLAEEATKQLSDVCESYALTNVDYIPESIKYYRSIERTLNESKF